MHRTAAKEQGLHRPAEKEQCLSWQAEKKQGLHRPAEKEQCIQRQSAKEQGDPNLLHMQAALALSLLHRLTMSFVSKHTDCNEEQRGQHIAAEGGQ